VVPFLEIGWVPKVKSNTITNTKLIQACLQSGKKATIAVENRVGTLRRPVAGSSFTIVPYDSIQASERLPFLLWPISLQSRDIVDGIDGGFN